MENVLPLPFQTIRVTKARTSSRALNQRPPTRVHARVSPPPQYLLFLFFLFHWRAARPRL